jgi:hypothetical protein
VLPVQTTTLQLKLFREKLLRDTQNEIKREIQRSLGNWKIIQCQNTDQYTNNLKQHVHKMEQSRIPRQMMTYRPKGKRSLGRPLKRWRDTVTGHWGLIRVRRRMKKKKLLRDKTRKKWAFSKLRSNSNFSGRKGNHDMVTLYVLKSCLLQAP